MYTTTIARRQMTGKVTTTEIAESATVKKVPTCKLQGSLIDIQNEHFTTFCVLSRCLKEHAFPDGFRDSLQEVQVTNSIWRLVAENNISLASAREFVAAQPKPIPQDRRILEAWWKGMQSGMEYRQTTVRRLP